MQDILKRKPWQKRQSISRAFIKILNKRMPNLTNILDDWGYASLNTWVSQNVSDKLWLYTNMSKKEYLLRNDPEIENRDLLTFENIRDDRLKCEIFINISFEPQLGTKNVNIYKLDIDADISLTLGDKEILTFRWLEGNSRVNILNLISNYYGEKEKLKEQNIYTTLRFNGMSIRSYVYSVNRLGDQSLSNMVIDTDNSSSRFLSFSEFVQFMTGNSLTHYGGAQTKLFKKEDKKQINLTEATKIAHIENIKSICLKQFKKDAPYIPYNNIVVAGTDGRLMDDGFYLGMGEILKLDLEELRKSDFSYKLEVINTSKLRNKKRRVKTRDVKIEDKEKGDWEASFEVIDLNIMRLQIQVFVNKKLFTDIVIENPKDFLYLLQDKLGEFQNTFTDFTWFSKPYLYADSYKYRQMHGEKGVKARTPDILNHKKILSDLRSGKITSQEAEKLLDEIYFKGRRRLKPQQHWKKKLRRKQYPVQMAFLHYQNKYTLYNVLKLKQLFASWRNN